MQRKEFLQKTICLFLSVSLLSCGKDEVPSGEDTILPYIEADQIEFTISAEPQSVVIHALTNVKWSAKVIGEDTGWLGMPAVEKSGDNLTIRIEVSENKAAESRKAFISLKPMEEYSLPKDYSIGDDMFFINQAAPNP